MISTLEPITDSPHGCLGHQFKSFLYLKQFTIAHLVQAGNTAVEKHSRYVIIVALY